MQKSIPYVCKQVEYLKFGSLPPIKTSNIYILQLRKLTRRNIKYLG
jgi:hypothetical protein